MEDVIVVDVVRGKGRGGHGQTVSCCWGLGFGRFMTARSLWKDKNGNSISLHGKNLAGLRQATHYVVFDDKRENASVYMSYTHTTPTQFVDVQRQQSVPQSPQTVPLKVKDAVIMPKSLQTPVPNMLQNLHAAQQLRF